MLVKSAATAALLGAASAQFNGTGSVPGATAACAQLASNSSAVLFPWSANYTTERTDYWDIRSDLYPACIYLPSTVDEVASAVALLTKNDVQFAVRGGGHMNFPGSNNINGGVLIALANLNTVTVDADAQTVDVGPGNRWVDVYEALEPYGLYCLGGRMKTIGVPGLTLLGGFHYFINKYGMVMDNILTYDVVLGNGTQVVASNTTNRDLFWALKGGASNYGIVTKFTIQAYEIPLISTTIQEFNETYIPEFLAAASDLGAYPNATLAAGQILSIQYNATTEVVSATLLGVQEGTESPPSAFANFTAIPAEMTLNNVTTPVVWHNELTSPNQMFRIQFAHKTITPNATQLYNLYLAWKEAINEISDVEGLYPTFIVNVLPRTALSVAKNNGIGNTWGLDDEESLIIWQMSTGWANEVDDQRMTLWASTTLDYLNSLNEELGIARDFLYAGDSGDFQNPFLTFPLENVERMRSIRTKYDAAGTFTRLNWGGFKLGY